jgi:hypothetical protein
MLTSAFLQHGMKCSHKRDPSSNQSLFLACRGAQVKLDSLEEGQKNEKRVQRLEREREREREKFIDNQIDD